MLNQKLVSAILSSIAIFLSWLLISFTGLKPGYAFDFKGIIIPFICSCSFIFLQTKNYFHIAVNAYLIFIMFIFADILNFKYIPVCIQLSYLLVTITATLFLVLLYQDIFSKKPRVATIFSFVVTTLLYLIPLFYIIYALNFKTVISKEVLYAILQTNPNEASEFYSDYISSTWIIIIFVLAFLIGFLLFKQEKEKNIRIKKTILIFLLVISVSLSFAAKDNIRLSSFAIKTIGEYYKELALFRDVQKKLKTDSIQFNAEKREKGEIYLVVIGESLNKNHMSLYGYFRNTTPLLAKIKDDGGLIVFNNAFSTHTHTMPVMSFSLTEANQLNKMDYYHSLSIINILKKSGFDTYWVTNQILYGGWDNLVSIIAHESDHLIALNYNIGKNTQTTKYDGAIITEVENILSRVTPKNKVIFIHLMGSHSIYCSRYPSSYKNFTEKLKPAEFGMLSTATNIFNRINCYDNSVLYNDYVVASLIEVLKKENIVTAAFYFSDHAEDVIGQVGHNADKFTFQMTQIPMIAWFSQQYRNRYQEKFRILKSNENSLYSSDLIYDTLIGIINIKTDRYHATHDLSSPKYYLKENDAYTLSGKIKYADKKNHIFHQKKNINRIINTNQEIRILPHRVNSIGKLKDLWFDGYRSFEVDVYYVGDNTNHFEVGHNFGNMSGISFEQFITSIQHSKLKKIWMDLKNLSPKNQAQVRKKLSYLDNKYKLKDKVILESSMTDELFRNFLDDGWHTSYYLPTKPILRLLKGNKNKEMKSLAQKLFKQSLLQKLSAFSFDNRLYPFVKNHLKPLLSKKVMFHTWDLSIKLYDIDLLTNLSSTSYFNDNRIKTILLPYQSPFNL